MFVRLRILQNFGKTLAGEVKQTRTSLKSLSSVALGPNSNMAGNETKNDNVSTTEASNGAEEQLVTIESVVAKDNKGIDYDKLISKLMF